MSANPTLASLAADLDTGRTTARKLVEECLARIADPAGEGARTFIHVDKDAAIAAADAMDHLRQARAAPSPYAGIPVSIKDLYDIKGQVTRAGSRALEDSAPADADAPVVARLRRAGFIVIGRTNMTEFAYSGIGINPHYGTPKSVWNRSVGHVPGGSSSGAAVSIADGMAHGALGTDTGGSCRIPAAYNGIVGFKPTQARVPLDGGVPLSSSLDSFGPLARTVSCCAVLDAVLADEAVQPLQPRPVKGMRLAVPTTIALDDLDDEVATTFERALETLSRQGASDRADRSAGISRCRRHEQQGRFCRRGKLRLASLPDRRAMATSTTLASTSASCAARASALPTISISSTRAARSLHAPNSASRPTTRWCCRPRRMRRPSSPTLADDKAFATQNLRALRNCTLINMLDGCAISLPAHREGEMPVGLMLAAAGGSDRRIFELAAGMENIIRV